MSEKTPVLQNTDRVPVQKEGFNMDILRNSKLIRMALFFVLGASAGSCTTGGVQKNEEAMKACLEKLGVEKEGETVLFDEDGVKITRKVMCDKTREEIEKACGDGYLKMVEEREETDTGSSSVTCVIVDCAEGDKLLQYPKPRVSDSLFDL